MNKHQPVHIYLDGEIYFLSVHIYEESLLLDDQKKKEILDKFKGEFSLYNYKWYAYAVLDNHYHLLFKTLIGKDLSDILRKVHGGLSYKWNKDENCQGRKTFQNYWDYCPRDEADFYKHLNYIHINPIKHGIIKDFEELRGYKFCSFNRWIEKMGEETVFNCLENYPVRDYVVPFDDFKLKV